MADLKKSADDLFAQIANAAREDLIQAIGPSIRKIAEAASRLESVLDGVAAKRGPGRPPGRPPSRKSAAKSTTRSKKRIPRGSLIKAVHKTLTQASGPLKLSQIREALMNTPMFRGRKPTSLYTQIVHAINQQSDIHKIADGRYALGGGSSDKKRKKARG